MDEVTMAAELLDEGGPSAEVTQAGRAGLDRLLNGDELAARRTERAKRRVPRLPIGIGLGMVAAAAAAAVAIATVGGGGSTVKSPPGAGPDAQATELPAQRVLLAAAEHAAKEPVGRYWRVKRYDGQSYQVKARKGGGSYTVLGYSDLWDDWKARSDKDPDVLYARDRGARPLTPEDVAAWRKDGSPTTFRAWSNDHWATLSTKSGGTYGVGPGGWQSEATTPAKKRKVAAEFAKICADPKAPVVTNGKCSFAELTWEEREKLANDPEGMKKLLFPILLKGKKPLGAANDLMSGFDFLTGQPASPQARATVFRLLAKMPDVRSIGTVKDASGRTGIGLAARSSMQEGSGTVFDYQLILEPNTYRILAGQEVVVRAGGSMKGMKPGNILNQDIVLSAGWTNESPHHD